MRGHHRCKNRHWLCQERRVTSLALPMRFTVWGAFTREAMATFLQEEAPRVIAVVIAWRPVDGMLFQDLSYRHFKRLSDRRQAKIRGRGGGDGGSVSRCIGSDAKEGRPQHTPPSFCPPPPLPTDLSHVDFRLGAAADDGGQVVVVAQLLALGTGHKVGRHLRRPKTFGEKMKLIEDIPFLTSSPVGPILGSNHRSGYSQ